MSKRTEFLCLLLLLLGSVGLVQQLQASSSISIVPKPSEIVEREGQFVLTPDTVIVAEDEARETGGLLAGMLMSATGYNLNVISNADAIFSTTKIIFEINSNLMNELGDEGYCLVVNSNIIKINAATPAGLFYGVQTLRQLFPVQIESDVAIQGFEWSVPAVEIKDKPRYRWRGMHLDVSRHFFDKEFVKEYIDLMAMHKMNIFHWHLTDCQGWRLEIKKYPLLTEKCAWRVDRENEPWFDRTPPKPDEEATYGGYYTQDEVREIIAYAQQRNITIVPEIEMPGHTSEVFAAYPQYSCKGEQCYVQPGGHGPCYNTFCVGNDGTFEFIQGIIDEVVELFPGDYIQIGGDEVDKTSWKVCSKCQAKMQEQGLQDEHELQIYFMNRISQYVENKGKKAVGWEEMFDESMPSSAAFMSWRGFDVGIAAANKGYDAIMCPAAHCYFDYCQGDPTKEPPAFGTTRLPLRKVYNFEPTPDSVSQENREHIIGGQANLWTELVTTVQHAEYMLLPRMCALSETLWTNKDQRNWDGFIARLDTLLSRFDVMGVNYRVPDPEDTAQLHTKTYYIPEHENIPVIDGVLSSSEIDSSLCVDMEYPSIVTMPNVGTVKDDIPENSSDLRATWYLSWDEMDLYAACRVYDESLMFLKNYPGRYNKQDCIQFALNFLNDSDSDWIKPIFDLTPQTADSHGVDFFSDFTYFDSSQVLCEAELENDGYVIEALLPWAGFDSDYLAKPGDNHGVCLMLVDYDSDGSTTNLVDFGSNAWLLNDVLTWNSITLVDSQGCGRTEMSAADLNRDCRIDIYDLAIIAGNWMASVY